MDSWFCDWTGTQGKENKLDTLTGSTLPELGAPLPFCLRFGFLVWGFLLFCLALLCFFKPLHKLFKTGEEDMEACLKSVFWFYHEPWLEAVVDVMHPCRLTPAKLCVWRGDRKRGKK